MWVWNGERKWQEYYVFARSNSPASSLWSPLLTRYQHKGRKSQECLFTHPALVRHPQPLAKVTRLFVCLCVCAHVFGSPVSDSCVSCKTSCFLSRINILYLSDAWIFVNTSALMEWIWSLCYLRTYFTVCKSFRIVFSQGVNMAFKGSCQKS